MGQVRVPQGHRPRFLGDLGLERLNWLKLDVEGAEVEVLRGAEGLLWTYRPRVLVENHLFKRATIRDEVEALLVPLGYRHVSTHPYHGVSHSVWEPRLTPR